MTLDHTPSPMASGQPAATLIVKQGPQIGIQFPITTDSLVIGREESCEIIIQDAEVSRQHSRIRWDDQGFVVEDIGSTNGTFINGTQIIGPTLVSTGDAIGLGQTTLIFESEADNYPQIDYVQTPLAGDPDLALEEAESPVADRPIRKWLWGGCGCLILSCIGVVSVLVSLIFTGIVDPAELPILLQGLGGSS